MEELPYVKLNSLQASDLRSRVCKSSRNYELTILHRTIQMPMAVESTSKAFQHVEIVGFLQSRELWAYF